MQCSHGDGEGHVLLEANTSGGAWSSLQSKVEAPASADASAQARTSPCIAVENAKPSFNSGTGKETAQMSIAFHFFGCFLMDRSAGIVHAAA